MATRGSTHARAEGHEHEHVRAQPHAQSRGDASHHYTAHHGAPHHGAAHHASRAGNERRVFGVMVMTGAFTVVQAIGGWFSGSLALLADSAHMLGDTAALAMAWLAFRVARRPADRMRSYGYHRFEILVAFVNGLALAAIGVWLLIEAWGRVRHPQPVLGEPMLLVAAFGLAVNVAGYLVLRGGDGHNLNLRAALLHVAGDLLGSLAAIVAAVVILLTGWTPIDPLLAALVGLLVLRGAVDLVRRSAHVLMEGVPEGCDVEAVRVDLRAHVPGVRGVHHVHAWTLSAGRTMVTLHLDLAPDASAAAAVAGAKARLKSRFGFAHSTIEVERGQCADAAAGPTGELDCDPSGHIRAGHAEAGSPRTSPKGDSP
jgi:cobalt-zinc-cadmium efflux system protein